MTRRLHWTEFLPIYNTPPMIQLWPHKCPICGGYVDRAWNREAGTQVFYCTNTKRQCSYRFETPREDQNETPDAGVQ